MTRVLVSGLSGKMGSASAAAIQADPALTLVGGVSEGESLEAAIASLRPDVVVDFTVADVAVANAHVIIDADVRPVIGTSGFNETDVAHLQKRCAEKQLGGLIAPNFAIGAVLMMQFAASAARFFERVEIVESHHEKKKDAPSGTAVKTAELIAAARRAAGSPPIDELDEMEVLAHPRGAVFEGINIHSLRVPGVVAEQQVILGDTGQTLRLEHRSIDRESFMPGVVLACKRVVTMRELRYGLEHILELS